jgi:hypothetical protein
LIRAVEDNDSETEGSSEIFCSLSLTCTGRASGRSTHGKIHGLSECDIASVSKRSDHKTTAVTDVLVVVKGGPIADFSYANLVLVFRIFKLKVELELGLPSKVL